MERKDKVCKRMVSIFLNFSLACMNFLPDMRLRLTKNSASILSYSRCLDPNKKLVLISAIEEPPVGILNIGQTNS